MKSEMYKLKETEPNMSHQERFVYKFLSCVDHVPNRFSGSSWPPRTGGQRKRTRTEHEKIIIQKSYLSCLISSLSVPTILITAPVLESPSPCLTTILILFCDHSAFNNKCFIGVHLTDQETITRKGCECGRDSVIHMSCHDPADRLTETRPCR